MNSSFHENRSVGLILTFIGGMMDSYTYIRYEAFASAQTGNLILATIQAFDHQWASVGKKLLSTLFFFLGILLAKYLIDFFREKQQYSWRLFLLYFEALVFFVISLPSLTAHPSVITVIIAFTAAVQWVAFDKINGLTYTNLFTTGNLKGVATNFYDYLKTKDSKAKQQFFHFTWVVLAFLAGVIVSVFAYDYLGRQTILLVSTLFLYLAVSQTYQIWRFRREIFSTK
ncbi:DUF1275 domain-containing protein [Enterococcus sp. 669A]|uniref:DUF1275 domain-containing protein n=1 Tax=Candidatus Enterococcus moelleringii TaxID=2815325 RepID=A0ABS3LH04_9ENTE|nr:DUF1275 domain-containing protein [Enterococcus sp. 669A]